jgi:anti-sigma factor RsiW
MTAAKPYEPSEIELLLPWYAAGTLSPEETRQVEAALAADPELASRYQWVRAEFAEETGINAAAGEPPADDVKALFAKIDALPARRHAAALSLNLGARFAEFLASLTPSTLAWSATAAALAIVLQAGVLAGIAFKERTAGGYETASAPTGVAADGTYVMLSFKPQASAADIADFLTANRLAIVDGPSGGQIYRVRVAPTKLAPADLQRLVATLRNDKVVGFVAVTD